MNKRIRRKKRVNEFAAYGFEVEAEWTFYIPTDNVKYQITKETEDKIWNTWDTILDYMNNQGYSCGGCSTAEAFTLVIDGLIKQPSNKKTISPTEKDKEKIIEFFKTIPTLTNVKASGWIDMWYPERKHNYKG